MLGVNGETVIVTLMVCFFFMLAVIWMNDEAKSSAPGLTKDILTRVGFSLDIANSIIFVIAFVVLIGVIIGIFAGGCYSDTDDKENEGHSHNDNDIDLLNPHTFFKARRKPNNAIDSTPLNQQQFVA